METLASGGFANLVDNIKGKYYDKDAVDGMLSDYATEQYVDDAIDDIDLTDYALKSEVPDDTSDLTNGAGFQTAADVASAIAGKADSSSLGTAAAKDYETTLTDGANLPTGSAVKGFVEGKGYQTSAQVESAITGKGYATTTAVAQAIDAFDGSLATVAKSGDYGDLANTPDLSDYATEQYVDDAIDDALEVIANGSY